MPTNYRYIRLENRECPACGAAVDAVCKDEGTREKYWFDCLNARDGCNWGQSTATRWSGDRRTTREEATETFDRRYGE